MTKLKLIIIFVFILTGLILPKDTDMEKKKKDFPVLKGPYLGQKPPGKTPELFAPGIVSTDHHEGCLNFTPDGKELYFVISGHPYYVIAFMKLEDNGWTRPRVAPFSGRYREWDFNLSPDGKKLYYTSYRPLSGKGKPTDNNNIWVVTKTGSGWSEPENLGFPVNTDGYEGHPSVTRDGTLYFHHGKKNDKDEWDIYYSRFEGGKYTKPVKLGNEINMTHNEYDPFIAPDESYLVFCSSGSSDKELDTNFYISFRKDDGSWTKAKNMGEKIKFRGSCPSVSPDGKYFFFTSYKRVHENYSETPITYDEKLKMLESPEHRGGLYWVDAKIIETFKPKDTK